MSRHYRFEDHQSAIAYGILFMKRKQWARRTYKKRAHAMIIKARRKARIFYYLPVRCSRHGLDHIRKPWARAMLRYLIQDGLPV